MITNARHFKQIKKGAYVEAGLNIVLSLILINFMGITGLVIGTSVAMLFRTTQIILYCSKHIIKRSPFAALKRVAINLAGSAASVAVSKLISFDVAGFFDLFIYAVIIGSISLAFLGLFNLIFFTSDVKLMFKKVRSVVRR